MHSVKEVITMRLGHNSTAIKLSRLLTSPAAMALTAVMILLTTQPAPAQTFSVIYSFGYPGLYAPDSLTIKNNSILYGPAADAGYSNGGVFSLRQSGSNWVFTSLYAFPFGDGENGFPAGPLLLATDGTLYGTIYYTDGAVFNLTPPAIFPTALTQWNYTSILAFNGSNGSNPSGPLTTDQSGNLYGTTERGGSSGYGTVYELTSTGNSWTETVLYSFAGGSEAGTPLNGVVFDNSGNLYGVLGSGGPYGQGAVYQLSPSQSGWTEQILYAFGAGSGGDGPTSLIIDPSGNLYGTTEVGGGGDSGTVFELAHANGAWSFSTVYSFSPGRGGGCGPDGRLTLDGAGSLYGTTRCDGAWKDGSVFKLASSNGGWTYTDLYDFTGGNDGDYPNGGLVFDTSGNIYGTALSGGAEGGGVAFKIAP